MTNGTLELLKAQHARNDAATPPVVRQRRNVDSASPLATDRQIEFINSLLRQLETRNRAVWDVAAPWVSRHLTGMTKDTASDVITRLKGYVAVAPPAPVTTLIPGPFGSSVWTEWRTLAERLVAIGGRHGGRFAVDTEHGAANAIAFWWISPGRDGRYHLRQVIGGQGAVRVRMTPEAMVRIAQKIIDAGPHEAMLRFGRELGVCGHCGTELTNDESRARGIGPVCANKER